MLGLIKCKLLCLCAFICFFKGVNGSSAEKMLEITQLCCNQGTTYARSHTSKECSSSIPPDVPSMYGSFCIFAMDQCCREYFQKKMDCETGIEAANSMNSCNIVQEAEKGCCDECAKGTAAGEREGIDACTMKSRGTSAEDLLGLDAYEHCCKKAAETKLKDENGDRGAGRSQGEEEFHTVSKLSPSAVVPSLCEEYAPNELCAHHCIPVPGSYKCECNPGFMLMADGRNCVERKVTAAIESHEALIPSAIKKIDTTEKQKIYGVMDLIRTPNMRLKTICIVFNWLKCGMVFFGIEHYLGHMSDNVLSDLAISAAFQLPGLLIVFVLISRVSRLKILIVANVLAGISLLLIIPFYNSDIAKLVLVTVALTCMTISFPTIFLYTGELFPTVVRNIEFAVCSVASKTGSIFAPFLIDYVDDLAYWVIPVVFGMGPILGAILCIWLPETMNCKLPETIEDGENFKRNKEKKPAASPI